MFAPTVPSEPRPKNFPWKVPSGARSISSNNGKEVKVKYSSPIASLSGDEQLTKLRVFMEFMAGMPPEVAQTLIAYEKIPQDILEALDLPESYVRSKAEVDKILQAQQQQQQQQMKIEQQKALK